MNTKAKFIIIIAVSAFILAACAPAAATQGSSAGDKQVRVRMVGDSMAPTLTDGTVYYMEPASAADLKRGDIIDFIGPSGEMFVKRVIAFPGETVEIHDGSVYLNGGQLAEAYATNPPDYIMKALTVGSGELFVLGDNRPASADSHSFGCISMANVKFVLARP